MSHAIVLLILVPLAGAFLISLVPDRRETLIRGGVAALAALHGALVIRIVVDAGRFGGSVYRMGGWDAPLGIVLAADALSGFFLIVLCFGHLAFIIHAFGEERGPRKAMWILTELLIAALSGIVVAGDLFNLFVFLELASVSSVGLMIRKQRAEGAGAGFVYLLYTSVSGVLYLIAVVLLYRSVGALSLDALALRGHEMPAGTYRVVVGLFIASIGMKFGLVPFHFWQAPAYDAAGSSAAALLSGTGMKIYLYVLFRLLVHVFRAHEMPRVVGPVIVALGSVNIIVGHLLALAERDLKRLLAYSSVAHAGYVLVALGAVLAADSAAASRGAAAAALLHAGFHSLMKSALFYSGRSLIDRRGSSTIEALRGVARAERVGFVAFIVAALSLVGVPPMSGFYSKWLIGFGAANVFGTVPVVIIAAGTVISMVYYARVLHVGLAESPVEGAAAAAPRAGASPYALALVAVLSVACVALGVFGPWLETAITRASTALAEPEHFLTLLSAGG